MAVEIDSSNIAESYLDIKLENVIAWEEIFTKRSKLHGFYYCLIATKSGYICCIQIPGRDLLKMVREMECPT